MREKALLYIVFFIANAIINRFANKWILLDAIKSAGKTWTDVLEFRRNSVGSSNQPRKLTVWLLSESPNPNETKKK